MWHCCFWLMTNWKKTQAEIHRYIRSHSGKLVSLLKLFKSVIFTIFLRSTSRPLVIIHPYSRRGTRGWDMPLLWSFPGQYILVAGIMNFDEWNPRDIHQEDGKLVFGIFGIFVFSQSIFGHLCFDWMIFGHLYLWVMSLLWFFIFD